MFGSFFAAAIIVATAFGVAPSAAQETTFASLEPATVAVPFPECPAGQHPESSGCVEKPDPNSSGASAQCRDGTYSHSTTRSGTCSGHHGVAQWCPCNSAVGQSSIGSQLATRNDVRRW
jgi:hypothetical protein